jgi:hypothetical protein
VFASGGGDKPLARDSRILFHIADSTRDDDLLHDLTTESGTALLNC